MTTTLRGSLVLLAAALLTTGCEAEIITEPGPDEPAPSDPVEPVEPADAVDQVDLVLVVDGSINMAQKQAVLAPSVRRLVSELVNPACVDAQGGALPEEQQPSDGLAPCPAGSARLHAPVLDLHLGVISSNLGDLGSGACSSPALQYPDDHGRLVARGPGGAPAATYANLGFLKWDPLAQASPAGEADLATFLDQAVGLILGVGDLGCGYEMPLEASYRFLSDPEPYASLVEEGGQLVKSGVDQQLLSQRAALLRPRSFVGVILLSDEDDCSLDPSAQAHLLLGAPFYRATSACVDDPSDACCTSCGLASPEGCASPDPACQQPLYSPPEDHQNLKCWDQKRRYGVEFRYPTARYVNALSAAEIDPASSSLQVVVGGPRQANPLFAGGRSASQVALATVVGVPWQDLVVDPSNPESDLKTSSAMEADGTWAWIVGDTPLDPFMVASVDPRDGVSPAVGEPVAGDNSINGGDRSIEADDLQYACTFALAEPQPGGYDCLDCTEASCDDPLCAGTTQIAGKAYPGQRQLEVVRGLGDGGVAGSICPAALSAGEPLSPGRLTGSRDYDKPLRALSLRAAALLRD